MNVLIVKPGEAPREGEIDNSLKTMQDMVGGFIEAIYPYDDPVALVCNEEGKLIGLPLNRKIEDYDIIAGTFFICGLSEDNFDSLPPDLMMKYKDKFAQPEQFMRLGKHIIDVPMEPMKEPKPPKQKMSQAIMNDERGLLNETTFGLHNRSVGVDEFENTEDAARYCRKVYDAGFTPVCPILFLSLFLNDAIPLEHKDGIDISRDFLRRAHVLVVCGKTVDEAMKNDIAIAERLRITATTLDGILTVRDKAVKTKRKGAQEIVLKLFKNKIFIGAICLLLAGVLAFLLLLRLYYAQASTVEIARLKQTVEYGTVITDDMLTVSEVGSYGLPDNVVTDKSEIIGLVADSTIYAGEYLWRDRFITAEAYAEIEAKISLGLSEGTYLLTICFPTTSSGIAGILRAGDIVDVYECAGDEKENIAISKAITAVNVYEVLNNKLVSLDDLDVKVKENPNTDLSDYDFAPAYVVFIVNEQQAKTLISLEKAKSLHLTLREAGI